MRDVLSIKSVAEIQEIIEEEGLVAVAQELMDLTNGENSNAIRHQLVRMIHYGHVMHIANLYGGKEIFHALWIPVRNMLAHGRASQSRDRDIILRQLVGEHMDAMGTAEFYYEQTNKILAQMIATILDYMLQIKAGYTLLYRGRDREKCVDLLGEIQSLNNSYKKNCYRMISYDLCCKKLSDYTGVKEYCDLPEEYRRMHINGMPATVTAGLDQLVDMAGEEQREYYDHVRHAYTQDVVVTDEEFNTAYQQVVKEFFNNNEWDVMAMFEVQITKVADILIAKNIPDTRA